MNTQDCYEVAAQHSDKTLTFLSSFQLAPTPTNFSVIYHYIAKSIPELNQNIDQQINQYEALDAIFIESLFTTFFSQAEELEKTLLAPFEQSLTNTMEQLKLQVVNGEKIASNFKKADDALAKASDDKSLKNIVNFIDGTLNTSKSQHSQLAKELAETYQQVSQLKSQLKASREEALHDTLTGLLNRRGCEEKLQQFDLEDVHTSLAIDIDHFKKVNDTFGHNIGDKVIQRVATTIQNNIGEDDIAVRYGGEEFVVVIANKAKEEAKDIAENIRIAITQLKLRQRKSNTYLPPISISIGIAENSQQENWQTVFERADNALYKAKDSGRNRCVIH